MIRPTVIGWIFWRNVKSYFSGVLGYLIIVAFVTICALLAFSQAFFANNYASLDELSRVYSWLLLFLIPAITMGAWAEEHKTGTDVLLFTLPASTWEILLGKYFAVSAVYLVAMLFSVTQLIPLAMLGQPDWSVVVSTYYGFMLAGLALLSIGLFASSLTRDSAVAFVLGMLFCSVPVLSNFFLQGVPYLDLLTIQTQLDQYANGIVTFTGLFYFGGLIALFLYLNHIVISQRFWARFGKPFMSLNFAVRALAFLSIVLAGFFLLERLSGRFPAYLDLTSERLYTLDKTTLASIQNVDESAGQVTIEAYLSAEVPADYVPTKKLLETLLSQYERLGGGRVLLRKVVVPDSTSDEATQAVEVGIEPISSQTIVGGKNVQQEIFLGVVVRTANGETVLPKFSGRDSIEYEITRAISMLSKKDNRLTIGVVDTDMHFAGLELQGQVIDLGFGRTKKELEKFYRIRRVNASLLQDYADVLMADVDAAVAATRGVTHRVLADDRKTAIKNVKLPDVLLVAGVSSLDQGALNNLIDYIKFGKPVLLLDDPVPFFWPTYVSSGQIGVLRSPAQPRITPQSPFGVLSSAPGPKADMGALAAALGVTWNPTTLVANTASEPASFEFPLLQMPMMEASSAWPEGYGERSRALVFFRNTREHTNFNPEVSVSAGLRELLLMYCGTISQDDSKKFQFEPLVSTDATASFAEYDEYSENLQTNRRFFDRERGRTVEDKTDQINPYTGLPERIFSANGTSNMAKSPRTVAAKINGTVDEPRRVIFICDTDFLSDLAYECADNVKTGLDNLILLQNAIENLAENQDDSFIAIRGRRPKSRPLEKIEEVRIQARQQRETRQAELETDLEAKLEVAQAKLDEKTKALQENEELSFVQRLQLAATAASEEQKQIDLEVEKLEKAFRKEIKSLEVNEKKIIAAQEQWTRFFAVLLPPLPALAIGISVVLVRLTNQANSRRKT
jgi:ABC-2 type transport system permease protein